MNVDKLKQLALAATQGEWFLWAASVYSGKPTYITPTTLRGDYVEICELSSDSSDGDQEFIAAANPKAIIELIAQRDELLAALKSLEKRASYMAHQCGYYQSDVIELVAARDQIARCEEQL